MLNVLEQILDKSGLLEDDRFLLRKKDVFTSKSNSKKASYRVKSNCYKIRAFELLSIEQNIYFRIYHAKEINGNLKKALTSLPGFQDNPRSLPGFKDDPRLLSGFKDNYKFCIDYLGTDYVKLATSIAEILDLKEIKQECEATYKRAKTSKFEGMELPDVDVSQGNVIKQTFTWREVIAIWENKSAENKMRQILSQNGIYIQRSNDGKSRYIGSSYGQNGIIGRWMAHLRSLGNAHDLHLYVSENGYDSIVFSVIEFMEGTDSEIRQKESLWKKKLGTVNTGPYNGIQLNKN